ncbi:MAG: manganese-dependent inorganic pyrophosphatase [Candidatus Altiarchaeales archaeon WOR_SM1_79]|nr:MAG: manganese-dependent inorganic pyrophosphatase [Candidatus Altiarchaeales archaeon WOR_SM1_79]
MDKVYITGHKNPDTDTICSAIAYADFKRKTGEKNVVAARCGDINPETKYVLDRFSLPEPEFLSDASEKRLILVDHNEFDQSIENIEKAQILEILDHHKINFKYPEPIYFLSKPLGSTSTIIAEKYFEWKVDLDKNIAGALLSAILSDTVVFRSVTTTERDKEMAEKLAEISGIEDIEEFGIEVKKAKSSLKGLTASEIILSDFKDFNFNWNKVGIGQIEIVDSEESDRRRRELIKGLKELRIEKRYKLVVLIVTNIMEEGSELLAVGDISKIEEAFGKPVEENSVYLKGVMSRKKEIVPPLERAF